MATSCVVRFIEDGLPAYALYKHCDGGSFGGELKKFYRGKRVVNGLSLDDTDQMNGMPDVVTQTIAFFKKRPGDLYMAHVEDEGDYTYEVSVSKTKTVSVKQL